MKSFSAIKKEGEKYALEFWPASLDAIKFVRSKPKFDPRALMSEAFVDGYVAGARDMNADAIAHLMEYRKTYAEDLFIPRDLKKFDPELRTSVAGAMGRLVLDNCVKDLRTLLISIDDEES
jgi:hypothetical protein